MKEITVRPVYGLHRLLRNSGNSNHYLEINLRGVQSNLRGISARVTVISSNGQAYRQNNGGGGGEHASQGSEPLHFGLGAATQRRGARVRWPSGVVDKICRVTGPPDNHSYRRIQLPVGVDPIRLAIFLPRTKGLYNSKPPLTIGLS